mgnify:FL=1|tara:strand:+ start:3371 stop:3964 length:594 start_codon:yes stop_codon:yes gene_type:complete
MLDKRREGRLTGSMVGAAIGANPHCSRQKAFRLITKQEVFEGNEMTEWGNEHEKDAILSYESITGEIVSKSNDDQEYFEKEFTICGYVGITPDGFTDTHYVEAKCPWSQKIPDEVPPHYMAQIQTGMMVTEFPRAHLIYWTLEKTVIFEIPLDTEYWAQISPLIEEFNQYLTDNVEPKRKKKPVLITPKQEIVYNER